MLHQEETNCGSIVYQLNFFFSFSTDAKFDWVIITSPEAGLVFLDAWR